VPTREQYDDVYDIAYRLSTLSETGHGKSFEQRVAWNVWQLERLLMFACSPAFAEGTSQWTLTMLRASAPTLDPNHKQERAMAVRSIMTERGKR
jgi:hypothetical protein